MFTEQLTQAITIPAASAFPQAVGGNNTTANVTVGPVNAGKLRRFMAHLMANAIGANVTNVSIQFQASNANNGTFTNVASGAVATLNTNNTEATVEVRADQLGTNNSWVQALVQVVTNNNVNNTAEICASLYAAESSYKPAKQYDYNTNATTLNRQIT